LYYSRNMHNPLIPEILSLLRLQPMGMSEYELMQQLVDHEAYTGFSDDGQLALFQKHFMIMNALYELQHQLWQDEQLFLDISPLKIQILIPKDNNGELAISQTDKLSEYYRDWHNFEHTDEEQVLKLLGDFWQRFISIDKRESAFAVLELEPDAAWQQITENYRRLAATHHPDKGGDKEMFIRIRQAYETLKINS